MTSTTATFIAAAVSAMCAYHSPVGAFAGVAIGGALGAFIARRPQPVVDHGDGMARLMADLYDADRLRSRVEIERRMSDRFAAESQALLDRCRPENDK